MAFHSTLTGRTMPFSGGVGSDRDLRPKESPMRKLTITVAAAIAVVGAGASTASAAASVAKPTTPHSWDRWAKTATPLQTRTTGHWTRKGKTITITGNIQDYSVGDTALASVIVRVRLA